MPKSRDDVSKLFRSLGNNTAPAQAVPSAAASAAASEAEQRWPLFKTMAPEKPPATQALSEQEMQVRRNPVRSDSGARKPALSLPGLSDKLATSLGKMSARSAGHAVVGQQAARAATPTSGKAVVTTVSVPVTVAEKPAPLFSRVSVAAPEPEPAPESAPESAPIASSLFPKKIIAQVVDVLDPPAAIDNSLSSIFGRLEGKPDTPEKTVVKRASFLGRLGNR